MDTTTGLDFGDSSDSSSSTGSSDSAGSSYPAYQLAADAHNIGNDNFRFTDPSTWSDAPNNVAKFAAVSAISAADSVYNTAITVGNWFGADKELDDTGARIASLDSNLGEYYSEHKQSADLVGFIASSFIPGLAGVKVLNAGQKVLSLAADTGFIGTNLSKATGLLVPATDMYRSLAASEIAQSTATFSAINSNTIKAIAAGYGQAALESAAFETSVAATMNQSPVLEDNDGWDIAKNILVGAGVGGVIGGAFTHAATMGIVKKGVTDVNAAEKLFTAGSDEILTNTSKNAVTPAQNIIIAESRLGDMPESPTASQLLASGPDNELPGEFSGVKRILGELPQEEQQAAAQGMETKFSRLRSEQVTKLQGFIRNNIQQLVKGNDSEFGNQIADIMTGSGEIQATQNFTHLDEIGRVGQTLNVEKQGAKQLGSSSSSVSDSMPITSDEQTTHVGYVKLSGENAGNISFTPPSLLSIPDVSKNISDVLNTVRVYKFKDGPIWDGLRDNITHQEVEARGIWADKTASVSNGMTIGSHDIPLLEKATSLFDTSKQLLDGEGNTVPVSVKIQLPGKKAGTISVTNAQDLFTHLQTAKDEVVGKFLGDGNIVNDLNRSSAEVAKLANVSESYVQGTVSSDTFSDLFARQQAKSDYVQDLKSKGMWTQQKEDNFGLVPTYMKAAYRIDPLADSNGNLLDGMAYITAKQKIYQSVIDNAVSNQLPAGFADQFYHPTNAQLVDANRLGAGPGLLSSSNANYGTLGSWAEYTGATVQRLQKAYKDATSARLQTSAYGIANNQDAAIEFATVQQKIMASQELYGFDETGTVLKPLKLLDYEEQVNRLNSGGSLKPGETLLDRPQFAEGTLSQIEFKTPEALAATLDHVNLTGTRTAGYQQIRNAQGYTDIKDTRAVRPIRPDLKDFPHFAIVVDPKVTGVGHKAMIHAATPADLDAMIDKVPKNFQVYTRDKLEQFHKDYGTFDSDLTLHENYIDSSLKSNGVDNPFFIKTDPQQIAKDFISHHLRSDDIFARELINAKFEKEINFLKSQGDQYTSAATSKYTGSYRQIESQTQNPYLNYVKTALNVSQVSEHPFIAGFNTLLDSQYSRAMKVIGTAFNLAKKPSELNAVNDAMQKYGVKSAYYDAATQLLANHTAPKGALGDFVRGANSILTNLTLRLDPMNSINNAVGANVLYGAETQSFLRAMSRGDSNAAGAMAQLQNKMKLDIPGLQGTAIQTHGRLLRQAIANFADKDATNSSGELLSDMYKRLGWDVSIRNQFHSIMDDLTLTGTESASKLQNLLSSALDKAKQFGDFGEKWSGNKLAESFNRFVAADTMRQITDHGIDAGVISKSEQASYINSFVNRTQGNIIASQRPIMFQGPVGQAIGLFQSYQLNLMQQLFRHVAEGSKKDTAMLLGLQGTLYGMNGLPAFQAINTHILGTASGNPQHLDAYSAAYGTVGKSVGDLLLYGLPSNLLQANLYTRGDINPRSATVIPTQLADVPIVSAFTKTLSNAYNMLQKMGDGGSVWQTFLQGVEHNGISRPAAGLAQTLQAFGNGGQAYSTTSKGDISLANDLFSWATAARLVGGKSLDEGITNDAAYRFSSYQASDSANMKTLGEAIKTSLIAGNEPTQEQIQKFTQEYAASGGNQRNFNKFMLANMKSANTSQADAISRNLHKSGAQNFQQIMGGRDTPMGNMY